MLKKILTKSMSDMLGVNRNFSLFQAVSFYLLVAMAFVAILLIS